MDWAGRSALVTGASRGIGRAVAVSLAARGARVAIVARDQAALAETAALCPGAVVRALDLTGDLAPLAGALDELGGRLDLLANVAGAPGRAIALEALTEADWASALSLNLLAAVRLQNLCLDALTAASGCIVNVGSIASSGGLRNGAAYAAAKAGLAAVTRAAAIEWARRGVRANLVEPGFVDTEFNQHLREAGADTRLIAQIPLLRAITAEEVAEAVLHLGAARSTTGATLRVDGGWTARM
jgi:NAD(P)-dependent dehydrogenase (short-subunit alcohol dehydrogenase family)